MKQFVQLFALSLRLDESSSLSNFRKLPRETCWAFRSVSRVVASTEECKDGQIEKSQAGDPLSIWTSERTSEKASERLNDPQTVTLKQSLSNF